MAACVDVVATGSPGLIDDFSDGNGEILPNDGRDGYWYVGTGQHQVATNANIATNRTKTSHRISLAVAQGAARARPVLNSTH